MDDAVRSRQAAEGHCRRPAAREMRVVAERPGGPEQAALARIVAVHGLTDVAGFSIGASP